MTSPSAIFTVFHQRRHIMSFAFVVFLSHSHLSSSLGILNLSFTILLPLHYVTPLCHSLVMCFCSLHVAFDIMSICNFNYVILFCHVLLSFLCRVPCTFPLSLSSVMLFGLVLLPSSFDVFIWHSVVVVYSSCFALDIFLTWTRKDMREEGRMRRRRRRRRRSGLHTNSNNPTLKGGEQLFTFRHSIDDDAAGKKLQSKTNSFNNYSPAQKVRTGSKASGVCTERARARKGSKRFKGAFRVQVQPTLSSPLI